MEKSFDLMNMQGEIQTFGEKYGLSIHQIHRLQICCEELIYEMLDHCYPDTDKVDMTIEVSYAELDKVEKIAFTCKGAEYDPFQQEDPGLGVTILQKVGKTIEHTYEDGTNKINITL